MEELRYPCGLDVSVSLSAGVRLEIFRTHVEVTVECAVGHRRGVTRT